MTRFSSGFKRKIVEDDEEEITEDVQNGKGLTKRNLLVKHC